LKVQIVEELNAQLVSLVGDDGAEMLISAFKSRRSITGPLSWLDEYLLPRAYKMQTHVNVSK